MGNVRTRGWQRAGAAACVAGLLGSLVAAPPAAASPDNETIWEEGTVTSVSDGDTLVATMDAGSGARGSQRVRTIGVQAPETSPEECGAAQAKERLRAQLPVGSRVQTRSVYSTSHEDDFKYYRIVRSLYAQDEEGNWYDTSRSSVSDGWLMWFPFTADPDNEKPEPAHNLEYRVLAEDAANPSQRRGLWSAPCGPAPAANLRLAVSWDQDSSIDGYEKVFIINDGAAVALGGWTLRDSALNYYRFPSYASVPGNGRIEVRLTGGADDPAAGVYYTNDGAWFNNLPADNAAFTGDAAYLMDNAGGLRTGNLRAWAPYPCNPDTDCLDPLKVAVQPVNAGTDFNTGQDVPSAPRQVDVSASSDKALAVTWQVPTYLGDAVGLDLYKVVATPVGGGAARTVEVPATALAATFTNLTPGAGYTVTVAAHNAQGWSSPSPASGPVTARTVPSAPTGLAAVGLGGQVAVRWNAPGSDGGSPVTSYTATATPKVGPAQSCTTSGPEQACVISGLTDGVDHTVTVKATNAMGDSPADAGLTKVHSDAQPADPGTAPGIPAEVVATPRPSAAVVTWTPPAPVVGFPITGYTASASVGGVVVGNCTTAASPSCVIPGLVNGSTYDISVIATSNAVSGLPSSAVPVTPAADPRVHAATGVPTPNPPAWTSRETISLKNLSASPVDLTGYALWDKDPRGSTDTPDYVFPRGTTIPANDTLRVRSGPATTLEPENATLHYTGKEKKFLQSGDRVELSGLNKALVSCQSWGGVTCRGQVQTAISSSPVGITARTTASSVTVNWGAPISRGGTAITAYTATAFDAPVGGNVIGGCSTDGAGRSCTFGGGIGTRYYVEVTATNAQGVSGPSWRVLAAPKTIPSAPGNVAASGTPGGLNITWTPAAENGATITKYTASVYTAGTGGKAVRSCTTSNGALSGCTVLGLQGGTTYYVDVTATNRAGTGPASTPRVAAQPGPGGAISTYSKGKVTVRWDAPTPGSNTVTGYVAKVYTKSSGGSKVGECTAAAGATQCTTKKMKKRSKYYIELTMRSASGDFTMKPRIVTGPARKASAPKVTSASPSGRSAVIAWAPPTFNGYSYLKGYGARLYSKAKGGSVKASCTANASTLTCTTKAVKNKKKGTYYAAVRVKNSKGWSSWSKRVKVVIP